MPMHLHTGGQKSWRPVPKYRTIRTMATVSDDSTRNEQATVAGYTECQSDHDNVKGDEDTGGDEAVIQRVEHIGKKSPRAFRVLADVMQNPQFHSKGGKMFLKQRKRMDKLAAETSKENEESSHNKHTLPRPDENSRVSSWELASISPAAVQYITKKSNTVHGKRWSPLSPGYHLPQPPALWRSKVEKDFPSVDHRNLSGHGRTLSEGNYVGMYNGLYFLPGTIHFNTKETSNFPHDVRRTTRFGRVERDFNARAKGWTRSLLD